MSLAYREIPLGKDLVALVDADLYPSLSQVCWHVSHEYAMRNVRVDGHMTKIFMHRAIVALRGIDIPSGYEVDHINRTKLDNRSENLRVVTGRANRINVGARRDSHSGIKGVSRQPGTCRWRANIRIDGRQYYLGSYAEREEAALAYETAAAKRSLGLF